MNPGDVQEQEEEFKPPNKSKGGARAWANRERSIMKKTEAGKKETILARYKNGDKVSDIAARIGCSNKRIYQILNQFPEAKAFNQQPEGNPRIVRTYSLHPDTLEKIASLNVASVSRWVETACNEKLEREKS